MAAAATVHAHAQYNVCMFSVHAYMVVSCGLAQAANMHCVARSDTTQEPEAMVRNGRQVERRCWILLRPTFESECSYNHCLGCHMYVDTPSRTGRAGVKP